MLISERPIAESEIRGVRGGDVVIPYGGEDKTDEGMWADSKARQDELEENGLW